MVSEKTRLARRKRVLTAGRKQLAVLVKGDRRIMPQSDYDKLTKKREELATELAQVDEQLLSFKKERQQELLAELRALGLDDVPGAPRGSRTGLKRQRDPNKPCPVCGQLGHDARRHRGENLKKKKA